MPIKMKEFNLKDIEQWVDNINIDEMECLVDLDCYHNDGDRDGMKGVIVHMIKMGYTIPNSLDYLVKELFDKDPEELL